MALPELLSLLERYMREQRCKSEAESTSEVRVLMA
jgi:hypothetical protein